MPVHSSRQPSDQDASPDLDLAFEAATDFEPELLAAAGAWADPLAGAEPWHGLFSDWLSALAAELPPPLRSTAYSLGLSLVGDAEIAALNADWRQKDGPTDVLAFAAQDADLDGTPPLPLPPPTRKDDVHEHDATDDDEPEQADEPQTDDATENATDEESDEDENVDATDEEDENEDEENEDQQNHDTGDGCEPLELGDIVISLDTAARQATEHGQSLVQELQFLASHGLLHLLGWDHPDAASLEAMLQRQDKLLQRP